MSQQEMFSGIPEDASPTAPATDPKEARVNRPIRNQMEMVMRDLDSVIPEDHPAKAIWRFLARLDLSALYSSIKAVTDGPGRPATDPQVLLALWVYATVDGMGSARRLEKLCQDHDAYRWLAGGVPINYHMLADFRVEHRQALDNLLTEIIGAMIAAGLVKLKGVAQDGVRIRAGAGSGSFRRRARLKEGLRTAREQVERLAQEGEHPDPQRNRREQAAKERAAREREMRVEEALRNLEQVQVAKERQEKRAGKERRMKLTEPRASTTDPEATVMKMPDGGFRPAYNVQLATDVESGVVVGVAVTNSGTDQGQALDMEQQVAERTGKHPAQYLMDNGFVNLEHIRQMERWGIAVYAPPRAGQEAPKGKEPLEMAGWRARMGTEEGKKVYKDRCSSAEWVNAQVKERHGLRQFSVRGLLRTTSVMLLVVITHNLLRWMALI